MQEFMENLSPPLRLAVKGACVVVPAGLGFVATGGAEPAARWAAVAVSGVAGGFGALKLDEASRSLAPMALQSALAAAPDPLVLTPEDVLNIGSQYGCKDMAEEFPAQMGDIYAQFVQSCIPYGSAPLVGDEAAKISHFKTAMGLSDQVAGEAHMEVGRRVQRDMFENPGSEADVKRTFRKLIFVSQAVFGEEKAKFCLPWKRTFSMNDAEIRVALKESGSNLYEERLEQALGGGDVDVGKLMEVRDYQGEVGLEDKVAAQFFTDMTSKHVGELADKAHEVYKKRLRIKDLGPGVQALDDLLAYNRQLKVLGESPDKDMLPAGCGMVMLQGRKEEDMRDLFRFYAGNCMGKGEVTDDDEANMEQLKVTLALGNKEVDELRDEVACRSYRKMLRDAVQGGSLAAAADKAAALKAIQDKIRLGADRASWVHADIYEKKLEASLKETSKLSDEDSASLDQLEQLLLVPEKDVSAARKRHCGAIYSRTLRGVIAGGIDTFTEASQKSVRQAQVNLKLSDELAKEILSETVKKQFTAGIGKARGMGSDKLAQAKELKQVVYFSNFVVTPLLKDLGVTKAAPGAPAINIPKQEGVSDAEQEAAMKEAQELLQQAMDATAKEDKDKKEALQTGDKAVGAARSGAGPSRAGNLTALDDMMKKEDAKIAEISGSSAEDRGTSTSSSDATLSAAAEAKKKEEDQQSQNFITLAGELETQEAKNLYKNFLMYCMTGEVVNLPMGSQIVMERDQSEFVRLQQLGEVLGLTVFDVADVHRGLSEQVFKENVKKLLADGSGMNPTKADMLAKLQKQLNMDDASAEKIIKGMSSGKMLSNLNAAISQGKVGPDDLRMLRESGIDIATQVPQTVRVKLYNAAVDDALKKGTPEPLDEVDLTQALPKDLGLEEAQAKEMMVTAAKSRKSILLVQAVSSMRQKKQDMVVKDLNNLLNCAQVDSEGEVTWKNRDDLLLLYGLYSDANGAAHPDRAAKLADLFKIDASEAAEVAEEGAAIQSFAALDDDEDDIVF